MKTPLTLATLCLLTACSPNHQAQNNDETFQVVCIEGLSYLTYQGSFIKNFIQIYEPAKDPAHPPQPKTCQIKK